MHTPPTPVTPKRLLSPHKSPQGSKVSSALVEVDQTGDDIFAVCKKLQAMLSSDDIEKMVGKIPKIITIGNESSGKSSMLQAIANVPLHIDPGTATRGPTIINSTHTPAQAFRASISIEVQNQARNGMNVKRFTFVERCDDELDLPKMLKFAGEEARRYDVFGQIRSYEQVRGLSEDDWVQDLRKCKEYTDNEVILDISGPMLSNLHFVDLPGVGKDTSANVVIGLMNKYTSQNQNLLAILMSGSNDNDTASNAAIRYAKEHDPKGERSMIILTKVDRIESFDKSPWIAMLTGHGKLFGDWSPKLGIWPLRLKGPIEVDSNMSDMEFRMIEQEFFNQSHWVKKATELKVSRFGITTTRSKLMEALETKLLTWKKETLPLIESKQKTLSISLANLPVRNENPINSFHQDIISEIKEKLNSELVDRDIALFDTQENLKHDLLDISFTFSPILKKHATNLEGDQTRIIHLDDMSMIRENFRNRRSGHYHEEPILAQFVSGIGGLRREKVQSYVEKSWDIVSTSTTKIVEEICLEKKSLAKHITQSLNNSIQSCLESTLDIVLNEFCENESADPSKVGLRTIVDTRWQTTRESMKSEYTTFYRLGSENNLSSTSSPSSINGDSPITQSVPSLPLDNNRLAQNDNQTPLHIQTPTQTPEPRTSLSKSPTEISISSDQVNTHTPKCTIPHSEAIRLISLMAHIQNQLTCSGEVLARNVGRKVLRDIHCFIQDVPRVMRESLHLNDIDQVSLKRCQDWFEPVEIRKKRSRIEKEVEMINEIRNLLTASSDDE